MATIQGILDGKPDDVFTVAPNDTVYSALEIMARFNVGGLPVAEGEQLLGFISERDYARKGILQGNSAHKTPISELMTTDVYTVSPDTTVEDCMALMTEHHIRHLPVLRDNRLIALVSIGDVVKSVIAKQEDQIQELHNYVTGDAY